jgi:hypothetical protein
MVSNPLSGPSLRKHAGVDVAEGAEVELLGPAARRVELAEEHHQVEGELLLLLLGVAALPARALSKIIAASASEQWSAGRPVEPVVGQAAAGLMEIVVAFLQRGEQVGRW